VKIMAGSVTVSNGKISCVVCREFYLSGLKRRVLAESLARIKQN
jgi:hypothetical protein